MKNIFQILALLVIAASGAYAQDTGAVANGKSLSVAADEAAKAKTNAPLILTKDQVERLADAEKTRQLARAQLQAAQNLLDKIEAQIDSLIKEFQIELKLDPAKYERDLRVIDQQRNAFGFFPKPEPKQEARVEPKK